VNIFVKKISENKLDVDGEDNVLEVQHKDIKVLTQEGKKLVQSLTMDGASIS
jgi:hypothetical protein